MGKKVSSKKLEKLIQEAGLSPEAAAALRAANNGEESQDSPRGHGAPAQARIASPLDRR